MNKKIKNRIVFYTMLLVLFVILNIVVSFAYLRGLVNNNESVSTIAIEGGGSISVVYSDNTGDIVNDHIIPGYETVKQFSVTSNISSGGAVYKRGIWYQIKLIVESNGFASGFLVYSLSLDDTSSTDGIVALDVNNVDIPNGSNLDLLVGTGYFINDNITHVYNLKINYVNMEDVDQTADYQTKFSARVVIDSPEYVNLTFDLDGGTFENLKLNSNSTMKVAANSIFDLPAPIKESYAFIGWEKVNGNVNINNNALTTSESDITVKATWIIVPPYEFDYTGGEQQFIVNTSGYYKLEAWGAQGGDSSKGGKGGYSSGVIKLEQNDTLYIYVGGVGPSNASVTNVGGYNGGGYSGNYSGNQSYGGGGATDFRLVNGVWNDASGLKSRILIAAGGAGSASPITTTGGAGGGLTGGNGTSSNSTYNTSAYLPVGSNQTSAGFAYQTTTRAGSFGYAYQTNTSGWGGGGGGGYYGGGNGHGTTGAGGSSYISGHTGCVAIVSDSSTSARTGTDGASCTTGTSDNLCSVHYSGKVFTDTIMIDGAGYSWTNTKGALQQMPNLSGGYYASGVGHAGNGYARITYLHA